MLLNKFNLTAAKFASADDHRPALQTLHVTRHCTESTDGTVGIRVDLPDRDPADFPAVEGFSNGSAPDDSTVIPADVALTVAKGLPPAKVQRTHPILENAAFDPASRKLATTDLQSPRITAYPEQNLSSFPNLGQCYPTEEPILKIAFNGNKLADALKFLASMRKADGRVELTFYGDERPVVIDVVSLDGQHADGIVMPLRAIK